MELKLKDIAELLQVSEKTIYRWIGQGRIPVYRINHQYRFDQAEIEEWILRNRVPASDREPAPRVEAAPIRLAALLKKGGIYYKVEGSTVREAVEHALEVIPCPAGLDPREVARRILEREALMPTSVGRGIMVPHPRTSLLRDPAQQSLYLCFLDRKLDIPTLDGVPVDTLFIILSASEKSHLEILYRLLDLCHQEPFVALLRREATRKEIQEYIEGQEAGWRDRLRWTERP